MDQVHITRLAHGRRGGYSKARWAGALSPVLHAYRWQQTVAYTNVFFPTGTEIE